MFLFTCMLYHVKFCAFLYMIWSRIICSAVEIRNRRRVIYWYRRRPSPIHNFILFFAASILYPDVFCFLSWHHLETGKLRSGLLRRFGGQNGQFYTAVLVKYIRPTELSVVSLAWFFSFSLNSWVSEKKNNRKTLCHLGGRVYTSIHVQAAPNLVRCVPTEEDVRTGCAGQVNRPCLARHCSASHKHTS